MPKAIEKKKKVEVKKNAPAKTPVKKSTTFTKSASTPVAKPASKTSPAVKTKEEKAPPVENTQATGRSVKVHKSTLIFAVIIILLGVLLYFGRGFLVAAVVNGQPISRLTLVQESEKMSGKQVMASLIRNALIEQEAGKKNITVSDKEINEQIKTIEDNLSKQGQKLDQVLVLEGLTKNDLKKILYQNVLVQKMVEKNIKISDKDINKYIEENKDILPKGKNEKELKEFAKDQIKKGQYPQKAQALIDELEKKAKIVKFVEY